MEWAERFCVDHPPPCCWCKGDVAVGRYKVEQKRRFAAVRRVCPRFASRSHCNTYSRFRCLFIKCALHILSESWSRAQIPALARIPGPNVGVENGAGRERYIIWKLNSAWQRTPHTRTRPSGRRRRNQHNQAKPNIYSGTEHLRTESVCAADCWSWTLLCNDFLVGME